MTVTEPHLEWLDDQVLVLDDVEFLVTDDPEVYGSTVTTDDRFLLIKVSDYLLTTIERFTAARPRNIMELGVYQGGSAVFWNLLLRPDRHLAIDLYDRSVDALDEFATSARSHGRFDVDCTIDQKDVEALTAAMDATFEDEPLDLVIDDASHLYFESRVSFETIFPRVRPGGLYVIEDWGWAHHRDMSWDVDGFAVDRPALSNLVVEIVLACTTSPDVVASVEIGAHAVYVRRGSARLDGPVALASLYANRGIPYRPLL